MRQTVIVDLDGTLADVGHRRHLVTGPKRDYWDDAPRMRTLPQA